MKYKTAPQTDWPWTIGVSGASGMRYALRLLTILSEHAVPLDVVVSEYAATVLFEEEDIRFNLSKSASKQLLGKNYSNIKFHSPKDVAATIASGSYRSNGMVIVPCSMSTLASVANGAGSNLIHRTADVCLKEKRKLIIVPRETPLSEIHLQNMLTVTRMGASIIPAMPGFYHKPKTIDDLIDGIVMRVLDHMGFDLDIVERWRKKNLR